MAITVTPTNRGTASGGPVGTVGVNDLPGTFIVQKADGSINLAAITNLPPTVQVCAGTTDAITFTNAINVAIFTSTGPDAATLATPGASDVGKVLVLVNTNTTQNAVTTAANKVLDGSATPTNTLTAPVHAGATAILVASNGFWNVAALGNWVSSEV